MHSNNTCSELSRLLDLRDGLFNGQRFWLIWSYTKREKLFDWIILTKELVFYPGGIAQP